MSGRDLTAIGLERVRMTSDESFRVMLDMTSHEFSGGLAQMSVERISHDLSIRN